MDAATAVAACRDRVALDFIRAARIAKPKFGRSIFFENQRRPVIRARLIFRLGRSSFPRVYVRFSLHGKRNIAGSRIFRHYGVRKEEEWCSIHQNCMSVAISTLPPAQH
jgi:hypothetical protein